MKRFGWVMSYFLMAGCGLMFAIFASTALMARGHAQGQPPMSGPEPTLLAPGGMMPGAGATAAQRTGATTTEPGGVSSGPTTSTTTEAPTMPPPPPPVSTLPAPTNDLPPDAIPNGSQPKQMELKVAPPPKPIPGAIPATKAPPPNGVTAPKPLGATAGPPTTEVPAAGTTVTTEEYVYDGTGRRDPFRRYRTIKADGKTLSPADLDPLLRYDVDQLTLLGILWDVRQPRALVRDSDGGVHTLVKNTKLGHNNGYVAVIREGEVVIVETFEEEGGGNVKHTRILDLKGPAKKSGGGI